MNIDDSEPIKWGAPGQTVEFSFYKVSFTYRTHLRAAALKQVRPAGVFPAGALAF